MKAIYADCTGVDLSRVPLSEDTGPWHHRCVSLAVDPLCHRYTKITDEEVVLNSHGTDTEETHDEVDLEAGEALDLLEKKDPSAAGILRRFEDSCRDACAACGDLIRGKLPDCTPVGLVYNSESSTVIRMCDAAGEDRAVKICRMAEEDFRKLTAFRQKLNDAGGNRHLIRIEALLELPNAGHECTVLIVMPLLRPAFTRTIREDGRVEYEAAVEKDGPVRDKTSDIVRCGTDIAKALAGLHSLGYVHHDVRPENFLIDPDGHFILADADSIRPVSDQYRGNFRSSSLFRAPELARRRPYGPGIDCYAWGRSIAYLLTAAPVRVNGPGGMKIPDISCDYCGKTVYAPKSMRISCDGISNRLYGRDVVLGKAVARAVENKPFTRFSNGVALLKALEQTEPE